MTVVLDPPWALWEDSTGEFSMGTVEDPDYRLVLWLDVHPVVVGARVEGVPSTAEALLGWLRAHPGLTRSEPIESVIGEMPATAVDVSISPAAVNDDPGCPEAVCQNFLGSPSGVNRSASSVTTRTACTSPTSRTAGPITSSWPPSRRGTRNTSRSSCRSPRP